MGMAQWGRRSVTLGMDSPGHGVLLPECEYGLLVGGVGPNLGSRQK
jgi:hypothetical protein